MNEYLKNIEDITTNFEIGMKRGYTSILILLILGKHPCYGYLIIKEIKHYTKGVWKPSLSTIYPILQDLKTQGVIKCTEKIESGRLQKIYEITNKGEEILKKLLQKLQLMIDSMVSLVFSTLGLSEDSNDFYDKEVEKFFIFPSSVKWLDINSIKDKIRNLRLNKTITLKKIKLLNSNLIKIDKALVKLEKFEH